MMARPPSTSDQSCHSTHRPAALVRLLDAIKVSARDRQRWFHDAQIVHDTATGVATLVIVDGAQRTFVEQTFHEALEAAVIAQGGRKLRITGTVAA